MNNRPVLKHLTPVAVERHLFPLLFLIKGGRSRRYSSANLPQSWDVWNPGISPMRIASGLKRFYCNNLYYKCTNFQSLGKGAKQCQQQRKLCCDLQFWVLQWHELWGQSLLHLWETCRYGLELLTYLINLPERAWWHSRLFGCPLYLVCPISVYLYSNSRISWAILFKFCQIFLWPKNFVW